MNFPDGEPSNNFIFPCRASPDGYSLMVHRQEISIFVFLTVIALSENFSFPVVTKCNCQNTSRITKEENFKG
jgi:hypothetical protein